MILEPLNDRECLGQLTAIAAEGVTKPEIKELAKRFRTTDELVEWIRRLPQRDDAGDPKDGPRVTCDVMQRARLGPADPNCVERAILYLAAAEAIDPVPARQLATIDVSETLRHTFPIEGSDPVVLDPKVRRNALRAGMWALRNGGGNDQQGDLADIDAGELADWLMDLAEDEAESEVGERGVMRVDRARRAMDRLLEDRAITPRDRADVLYSLRLAGSVARWFGRLGTDGYRVARALLARLVTRRTVAAHRVRNVSPERVVYWGGKAVATYYGVGGLYDVAYAEVRRRPGAVPPKTAPKAPVTTAVPGAASPPSRSEAPAPERTDASPEVLGTLGELSQQKGA